MVNWSVINKRPKLQLLQNVKFQTAFTACLCFSVFLILLMNQKNYNKNCQKAKELTIISLVQHYSPKHTQNHPHHYHQHLTSLLQNHTNDYELPMSSCVGCFYCSNGLKPIFKTYNNYWMSNKIRLCAQTTIAVCLPPFWTPTCRP